MKAFDDMDLRPEPRSFLLVDVRRNDWEVCDFLFFLKLLDQLITSQYHLAKLMEISKEKKEMYVNILRGNLGRNDQNVDKSSGSIVLSVEEDVVGSL